MNNKKKCFVIMPFSDTVSCSEAKWEEIFEHIIKPAVQECGLGYECNRYCLGRSSIVKDILEDLNRALLVIADLTDNNANVMWELGVRHTLRRRTILIAQDKKFLPSDLKDYPIIIYNQTKAGFDKFKAELKQKLEDIEKTPDKSDSPIAEFLGTKNMDLLAHEKSSNLRKLDALLSELFCNLNEIDNIEKQLSGNIPPSHKLRNTCIKLVLSTRYINFTEEVLNDLSVCDRMIDWFNQQVDFAHQSLLLSIEEIPKQLSANIEPIRDKCISVMISVSEVRNNFASDNYQEEKYDMVLLSNPELQKYLKLP